MTDHCPRCCPVATAEELAYWRDQAPAETDRSSSRVLLLMLVLVGLLIWRIMDLTDKLDARSPLPDAAHTHAPKGI